jgi:hypothetical protein
VLKIRRLGIRLAGQDFGVQMPAVQLTKADRKFWSPDPRVLAWVSARIPVGAKVLEIGPGTKPFPRASHFVDLGAA